MIGVVAGAVLSIPKLVNFLRRVRVAFPRLAAMWRCKLAQRSTHGPSLAARRKAGG
jgi:hypothetical protein